ncbi:MAG: ACP S-malonyltransferase [Nevskiales bacterium]|nr:ACP S-malonyltransferase [Nevskiales bacterium]
MKYAVLFPGQGSQSLGMLSALAAVHPLVTQTFSEAGRVLGWDLAALVRDGPLEELNRTERTQPALLAAGIAVWRVLQTAKPATPHALAGHSLGEYTALVAAGSLSFSEALKLVELRGRLMQEAVPPGAGGMAAVLGLDDAGVEKLCAAYTGGQVLEPVNYNAPGQVVVAGSAAALDWLESHAQDLGARRVMRLPVSVPSHCSLMKSAAQKLAERLDRLVFQSPVIPVLHNVDAVPHPESRDLRTALHEQLYRPVRWTQTLRALQDQGVGLFLECGPGRVLSGLNKRIGKLTSLALEDPAELTQAQQQIGRVT